MYWAIRVRSSERERASRASEWLERDMARSIHSTAGQAIADYLGSPGIVLPVDLTG
jgi:hypothetical protein